MLNQSLDGWKLLSIQGRGIEIGRGETRRSLTLTKAALDKTPALPAGARLPRPSAGASGAAPDGGSNNNAAAERPEPPRPGAGGEASWAEAPICPAAATERTHRTHLMQLTNRPIRTALALAVCQLLLACTQPAKNNFVSHFREDTRQSDYVFLPDDDADAAKGKKSESADSAKPRILDGTGKLLGEAKSFPAVEGKPVKLNFEDAPLSQVVRTVLGDILSLDYVLHPPSRATSR